jgi:hypothetical protein
MKNQIKINSFHDFWPMYLRAHASAGSRALHFAGLALSVATAAALLSCGMVFFLVLAIVPAQLGAYLGHKLSPRHDDVAADHPDWAALADVKMFALAATGRLETELRKASVG